MESFIKGCKEMYRSVSAELSCQSGDPDDEDYWGSEPKKKKFQRKDKSEFERLLE
jgi:hypothetical protein